MQNLHESKTSTTATNAGRVEVKHLRLVQAIAKEGSVTRAAGGLHLSQSAVSHQLVDLERDLGTRLFDRIGKRMIATVAGTRMIESAERLLTELSSLERDLEDNGRSARIPMRVTTSCYTSYNWLASAMTQFATKHPRVDLAIVIEATRRALEALSADEVDLAIVNHPPKDPSWATSPIVSSEFVALASPHHLVMTRGGVKRGNVKWRDLRGTTVLVHDISDALLGTLQNAVRESWQKKSGERLANPIELRKIPLTEALIELARSNSGVVIIDRWMLGPYFQGTNKGRRDLVCLPFSPSAGRSFHAVWRKQNARALPMQDLADMIRVFGCEAVTKRRATRVAKTSSTRR